MASSSTSPSFRSLKHHVFLCFRGADTRHSFVSHLYGYLHDRLGIPTFIDNRLERGEAIEPAILNAIQDSHISVIIFSKSFASSPYCLDEVVKILECKDKFNQKVIPVFYHVDPDDVSNQTGSFSEDFAKLDQDFKDDAQRLQSWRIALSRAASIAGEVLIESRSEYAYLQDIVKSILNHLRESYPNKVQNLVGMQSRIESVESLLSIKFDDVRIVGLWGMGGIGKTTLARVVFENLSSDFDCKCFIDNVREKCLQTYGQAKVEEEILVKVSGEKDINPTHGLFINMLRYKRILLVLDDVEDFETIKFAEHSCFGPGSRIIITSRDKGVLEDRVDEIYEVEALSERAALQLFSLYAFKQNHPKEDHLELSESVIRYARGIPLVVIVLASFLRNKRKELWKSALNKLEISINKDVQNILKLSYDGLDSEEQEVFLHIACFFKGETRSQIERLLDACGFSTLIDLTVLENKSLINIFGKKVLMHDLLQQMGQEIVRQESKEPGKRSRLFNPEDVQYVLMNNTGTESVEGMFVDQSKIGTLSLDNTVFSNMKRLKMLKFYDSSFNEKQDLYWRKYDNVPPQYLNFPQGLQLLSNELRYLKWIFYPLKALPSNYHFQKLVELNMYGSSVEKLWSGVQILPNLKEICMDHCRSLVEMPDLSGAQNLEIISFVCCIKLLKVCPSIQYLNKLHKLNLQFCIGITTLPNLENLTSLTHLCIDGCSKINKFPGIPTTIQELTLGRTPIEEIPSSIGSLFQLRYLDLTHCDRLRNLSNIFIHLKHVLILSFSGPYVNTSGFLNGLCCLSSLRILFLQQNDFQTIPSSIKQLPLLTCLLLGHCKKLQSLPELPPDLKRLEASHCISLQAVSLSVLESTQGWGHFHFIGCISLDHKCLLIHGLQRILQIACKTWERLKDFGYSFEEPYSIVFPGDSIPNWIQHQNTGFSIKVPLPPNWYENFMGFAFSAVLLIGLAVDSFPKWMRIKCQFQSKDGESYCISARFDFFEWDTITSKLEHLLLYYNSDFWLKVREEGEKMGRYNEVSIGFVMEDFSCNSISSTVQKCGVRLLYKGDNGFIHEPDDVFNFHQDRTVEEEEKDVVPEISISKHDEAKD